MVFISVYSQSITENIQEFSFWYGVESGGKRALLLRAQIPPGNLTHDLVCIATHSLHLLPADGAVTRLHPLVLTACIHVASA